MLVGPARRAKASFVRQKWFAEAATIDHLVTGAIREPDVDSERGAVRSERVCPRCGAAVATRWHELYACPANDAITDPAAAKMEGIAKEARSKWEQLACLWTRGIMPGSWLLERDEARFLEARVWVTEGFRETVRATGHEYTDGAGWDKRTRTARGRTASGGVTYACRVTDDGPLVTNVKGFYADVPGMQSVPRAEGWAVAMALHGTPRDAPVRIGVDASYVHNGVLQRRGSRGVHMGTFGR